VRHSWMLVLCLIMFGCSAFKPPSHPQAKEDADTQLRFALILEANRDYEGAEDGFNNALDRYSSFGDLKGQLAALSGLARLELTLNIIEENRSAVTKMESLIQVAAPELDYYLLLLRVHKLQMEKDFTAVSQVSYSERSIPLEETIQLAIAKLQADSFLQTATPLQVKRLIKDSKKLHKQIKKRQTNSLELMSSAWYALGYYFYQNKDYENADIYLDKAADWDYRFGNFSGLGHCLWLKAQSAAVQNRFAEAKSCYTRAEGIFISLGETALQQTIQLEMTALKGESP